VIKLRETWKLISQLMEPVEALGREAAIVKAIEGLDAEEQSGVPGSLGGRVRGDQPYGVADDDRQVPGMLVVSSRK
jgi:hypothetical protein